MFEIVIKMPEKPEKVGRLAVGVYRVGSSPAAHIQLDLPEVSSRHALLTVEDTAVFVEDAGSTNGTLVDDRRIDDSPVLLEPDSVVRIGGAELVVRSEDAPAEPAPPAAKKGGSERSKKEAAADRRKRANEEQLLLLSGIPYEYRTVVQRIKTRVHEELLTRVNLKNLTLSGADSEEIASQARATIVTILKEYASEIPSSIKTGTLEQELVNEAIGLGPIEKMLADPEITEIMVNGAERVYAEKDGVLYRTDFMFADDDQVLTVIERIVAPLGRRIDESQPLVDARLLDGSRVNAIIPPLAIDGPTLTIRKFSKEPMTMDVLIKEKDSLSIDMADFSRICVLARKNILISGGTGSGKTTLLNAVSNFLPNDERIVTIEDAAELRLMKTHVVRLESRPPNIEGRGEIKIRDLVRNSLRMRPDRIVVGECRGGEALDMLQAMNTGHDGSLTTIHANTTRDALTRLETLVLMAGFDLPLRAIREQISSAIDIIIQIARMRDGSRRVTDITEVTGMEGEVITTQEIYVFDQEGLDDAGKVKGIFRPCGIVPTFLEDIAATGLTVDLGMFTRGVGE